MLQIPGFSTLFGSRTKPIEQNSAAPIVRRAETIIVAKDGSGDTDDIQEGINMLPSSGGIVQVKEGVYEVLGDIILKSNMILSGVGYATEIKLKANSTKTAILGKIGTKSNMIIQNLRINGNKANQVNSIYGIYVTSGSNNSFLNLYVHDCKSQSILNYSTDFMINRCIITGGDQKGIYAAGNDGTIMNCIISGHGNAAIQLHTANRVAVIGNVLKSNQDGVYLYTNAQKCIVSANLIYSNTRNGVYFYSGNPLQCFYHVVVGNQIWSNGAYGIREETVAWTDYNLIVGNMVRSNTTAQISLQGANSIQLGNL